MKTVSLNELRKLTGKKFFLYAPSEKFSVPVPVQKGKLITSVKEWVQPKLVKGAEPVVNIIETSAGYFVTSIG